jgi:hypothetical protein
MANGNATELKEYRQKIMIALVNDKLLCELLLGRTISTLTSDIQDELKTKQIFRHMFVPEVQLEEKAYITFDLNGEANNRDGVYKNMSLDFVVFCHYKCLNDENTNYLRTDLMTERIQYLFNENISNDFGIGLLKCFSDRYTVVNNTHYGRKVSFRTAALNSRLCG